MKIRLMVLVSIIVLFVTSCKNPFYKEIKWKTAEDVSPSLCVLTAETDGTTGRAAFPSSVGTVKYYGVIKAPDGKYLTDNASHPVSSQIVFLGNKNAGSSLKFLFAPYSQGGQYEITIYAFTDGVAPGTGSAAHYKAKAAVKKNLQPDIMQIDLGTLVLKGNTEKNAPNGTVNLPLSIDASSGIKRIELMVKRWFDDGSGEEDLSGSSPLIADLSGSPKKITHTGTGISPGIYTLTIKAYDASSGGNQIFLENPVQTVTVFSGCETITWYGIDGNPLSAGSSGLTIQPIDTAAANTFFVKGTGGSLPNAVSANDGNSGMSIAAPLASLNAALAKCTGSGPYTVYVDGEVTEPIPSAQAEINKAVTIKSLSTRAAVKKGAGFNTSLIKTASGGNLIIENIVLDGNNSNYTDDGGLVYNEGTLRLKNGTQLISAKARFGGAVYNTGTLAIEESEILNCIALTGGGAVYNAGIFTISGSAKVTLSTGNDQNKKGKNDVYLESGKFITVTAPLDPAGGIIARITSEIAASGDYTKDTVLVKKDPAAHISETIFEGYALRFLLTPTEYSEWELYCHPSSLTELKTVRGAVLSWKGLKKAVAEADNDGRIIVKDSLKATKDADNSGEIEITKNLTIKGESEISPGILDANSNHGSSPPADAPAAPHRIFTVGSDKRLILQNLTLKGGKEEKTDRSEGGAVYVDGGELVIKDCIIRDCKAAAETPQGKAYGGAVYMKGGKAFFRGNTQIIQCAVKGAQDGGDAGGGAVYIGEGAEVTMKDTALIKDCKAECEAQVRGEGGGAAVIKGTFTMQDGSKITGCIADGVGGAIYGRKTFNGDEGTIVIKGNSEVSGNTSQKSGTLSGGGIYSTHELTVSDSALISGNNSPHGNGGGIAVLGNCDFSGGTVKSNTVSSPGGLGSGIYIGSGSSGSIHFNMSGTAHVEYSNDIYLINNKKITLTGSLSHASGTAGRITPESYREGKVVLAADTGVILANEAGKFDVTSENSIIGGTQAWTIDSAGTLHLASSTGPVYTPVSFANLDAHLTAASDTEAHYIKVTDIDASQLTGSVSGASPLGQILKKHSGKTIALALPDSTNLRIGRNAFKGCTGLKRIDLSTCTHLTAIGVDAFQGCTGLAHIQFPVSLVTIGHDAFLGCTNLTGAVFPHTTGWSVYNNDNYTGHATAIPQSDLEDAAKAAEHLRKTYKSKEWKRQ